MQTNDAKSIKECLQSNALKLLVQKAQKILALETFLNQILPPEIVPYCRIMNLSQGTLTLHLKSPVWATRVHYLGPYLLNNFLSKIL